jgi:hypothetical protein
MFVLLYEDWDNISMGGWTKQQNEIIQIRTLHMTLLQQLN